jgi:hypothetical protein
MSKKSGKLFASALVLAIVLCAIPMIMPSVKATNLAASPPSFWVEPETESFNTVATPVGTLFNVTVWGSTPVNDSLGLQTFAWQVNLGFNTSQLQAVKAGYTAVSSSELFAGLSPIPVKPVLTNTGSGSVLAGETLLAPDSIGAENASLFWAEFNVTAAPSAGQTLTCNIDPAYGLTPGVAFATKFLDVNFTTTTTSVESGLTTAYSTYSLAYATAVKPTISNVTQVPSTVNESQSVTVSANVTDMSGSGIQNVTLLFSTDGYVTNSTVLMTLNATTGLYNGVIPGYPSGTTVNYDIWAYDNAGDFADLGALAVSYPVVSEFPSVTLLVVMMMATLAAAVLIARKRRVR